jgi:hypothetical protein
MIVIPPVAITDSLLVSSTAFEVAPAAYNSGTTYALGAFASVAGSAGLITVYKSLQNGNLNKTPASNPSWWAYHCDTYQQYSGGTTYALGDVVIDATAHKVYESLAASNTGNALTDATKWLHTGTTNKWAMFDFDRSIGTSQASPLVVSFTPGERIDSIAILGVVGTSVQVDMEVSASVVYTRTASMTGRETLSWSDYFFGNFDQNPSLLLTDLPPFANATVTVTITGSSVSCGACVVGRAINIGEVQYGATNDALNFSRIERDDFGNGTLNRRKIVPKTNQTLFFEKSMTNKVIAVRKSLNAAPAVWSGLVDTGDGYFDALLILGIYKQFEVSLKEPSHGTLNLELEEM